GFAAAVAPIPPAAAPVVTANAPTATATPNRTILQLSGSGPETTPEFDVAATWAVAWNYDCSKAPPTARNFVVDVDGGTSQTPVSQGGQTGTNVTYFHVAGHHYLKIDTDCAWNVRVFNAAGS
ncbi:MAG: hypothetical protein ABI231_01000, partial [Candidatus Tumulicola sp.]